MKMVARPADRLDMKNWFVENRRLVVGLVSGGIVMRIVDTWPRTWDGFESAAIWIVGIPIVAWIANKCNATPVSDKHPGAMDWTNEGHDSGA